MELLSFFATNHLLADEQYGFRVGRSCATQLLFAMDSWTDALQQGIPIDVIYHDFSKAFDSVPHQRLLVKLKAYGVQGKLLNWIEAFLTYRQQHVVINNAKSDFCDVISGVPQGSVLGPLLFLIYINDLPTIIHSPSLLFADDTKIFRRIASHQDYIQLQQDILALEKWSKLWQLNFNCSKTFVMHLGKNNPGYTYNMSGKQLETVKEHKDLGVLVDSELKFHHHSCNVTNKASQVLGIIKKSFTYLDSYTFPLLYKSLVRPHLEYANVIWGPTYVTDSNNVESVQRRATRWITELSDLPYHARLQHLNLPALAYRRHRADMIMTYNILHHNLDINPSNFFQLHTSTATRGHNYKIYKPHAAKNIRNHFFAIRVINHWNNLPWAAVNSPSINDFKRNIDDHYYPQSLDYNLFI